MAQAQAYATYLVELAMLDYSMLGHTYSMVAAGAVVCANRLLGREDDCPHALQKHCGYTRDQLLPCAHELAHLHAKSVPSWAPCRLTSPLTQNAYAVLRSYSLLAVQQLPPCILQCA